MKGSLLGHLARLAAFLPQHFFARVSVMLQREPSTHKIMSTSPLSGHGGAGGGDSGGDGGGDGGEDGGAGITNLHGHMRPLSHNVAFSSQWC